VYTLYGHLSQLGVQTGETVQAGQEIGKVGSSGDISGSSLHFEVRYGENQFQAAVNPVLWLAQLPDETGAPTGALAGSLVDAAGNYPVAENIVIERLAGPGQRALDTWYLKTYADDRYRGAPPFEESFALGNLPAGEYQITFYFNTILVQREVNVEPGKLTKITIQVP
jgi:hypothetical protein